MEKLLLLHGALGSKSQFRPIINHLQEDYECHAINFSGHGGKPFPENGFHFDVFVEDILNWMDENEVQRIPIFGYSMGGYAALLLALRHPERVSSIFTLGTKFNWLKAEAQKEVKLLDPDKIEAKVPQFAQALIKRHSPQDWKAVLQHTADMMLELGEQPLLEKEHFQQIEHEVIIGLGDQDYTADIEPSVEVFRQLKNGHLLVLPDTPHPLEKVNAMLLCHHIRRFFG